MRNWQREHAVGLSRVAADYPARMQCQQGRIIFFPRLLPQPPPPLPPPQFPPHFLHLIPSRSLPSISPSRSPSHLPTPFPSPVHPGLALGPKSFTSRVAPASTCRPSPSTPTPRGIPLSAVSLLAVSKPGLLCKHTCCKVRLQQRLCVSVSECADG